MRCEGGARSLTVVQVTLRLTAGDAQTGGLLAEVVAPLARDTLVAPAAGATPAGREAALAAAPVAPEPCGTPRDAGPGGRVGSVGGWGRWVGGWVERHGVGRWCTGDMFMCNTGSDLLNDTLDVLVSA